MLLLKCRGDEIWTIDDCREEGIPEDWIEQLKDCFESGFDTQANTIFHGGKAVNQYFGITDLQLACKLAEYIGIDVQYTIAGITSRTLQVRALKEALDEI